MVVEISPTDEQRAWNCFRGSDSQRVLHNACEKRIAECQLKLESVMQSELAGLQAEVRVYRQVLNLLHSKDTNEIKEIYGRQ